MSKYDEVVRVTGQLVKRAGGVQFEIRHNPIPTVNNWFAVATFPGDSVKDAGGADPYQACMRLAVKLLDGTVCGRCNHVIALTGNDDTFCQWRIRKGVWAPSCGLPRDPEIKLVPHA